MAALGLPGWCLVVSLLGMTRLSADDEGTIQITFMRDRVIFVQLKERMVADGERQARQQFFEIVNDGEASLSEAIVARWTTGLNSFDVARGEAASRLSQLLTTIQSLTPLTDEQLAKLRLAGQGDISRFVDECGRVWTEHESHKVSWTTVQELSPRCQGLRERFTTGLHGPESLLSKLLATMLSVSELERVTAAIEPGQRQRVEVRAF